MKYSIKRSTKKLSEIKKHPLVDQMGYLRPDELYIEQLAEIGLYKAPLITEDGYYITLPDYIEASIQIGAKEIDVIVIEGCNGNDLLKIINFESRPWYRASKTILYKSIKTLQQHLWNTDEGRAWRDSLPGGDVNDVIGRLVGYSASTISLVKYIGENNYPLLDQVDDPDVDMTLSRANQIVKANLAINAKKDNYSDAFYTNLASQNEDDLENDMDEDEDHCNDPVDSADKGSEKIKPAGLKNGKPPKQKEIFNIPLTSFSVGLGQYGDYTLDMSTGSPAILYNDKFAGFVKIKPKQSNNPNEGLHFVMQNAEAEWSFHVIVSRINKLIKQQEVCCSNDE